VEDVEVRVSRICEDWGEEGKAPDVLPTHEDIGRLYLAVDDLRHYARSLNEAAEKLVGTGEAFSLLTRLDTVRVEANLNMSRASADA